MSLSQSCSQNFSAAVRSRGEHYFRCGSVTLERVEGQYATAVVEGSEDYEVDIDWSRALANQGEVGLLCNCPYFSDKGACKHVWATLLALDQQRVADELAGPLDVADLRDLELEDEGYDSFPPAPASASRKQGSVSKPTKANKTSLWQAQLQNLATKVREQRPAVIRPVKERRVVYAIDVPLSQQEGRLVLRLLQQERKRDGDFGKPTRLVLDASAASACRNTQDGTVIQWLLQAAEMASAFSYGYRSGYTNWSEFALSPVLLWEVLPKTAATGRLVWGLNTAPPIREGDLHAILCDDGPPWRLKVKVSADEEQQQWQITGRLVREGDDVGVPLASAVFTSAEGVVLWPDRIARLEAADQSAWLDLLRRFDSISIPYADRGAFLKQLFDLPLLPTMELPENLRVEQVQCQPQARLTILAQTSHSPKRASQLSCRLSYQYGQQTARWNDDRSSIFDAAGNRLLVRDTVRELELLQQLAALGIQQETDYWERDKVDFYFPQTQLLNVFEKLPAEHWQIEAEGKLLRRAGAFAMQVTSGVDWFELTGECDFGGVSASLPDILAAVKKGERYVPLGDGTHGMLPQEWLAKYGTLAEFAELKDDKLQFKPTQAMLLDALLASQETVKVDRKFDAYRRKLQTFAGIEAATPPRMFKGELRPYQCEGLGWMRFLQDFGFGGCLADDMGLGKTVQVLALLECRRSRRLGKDEARLPSLVVVPRSLIFNWKSEAARFAPKLRVLDFSEPGRKDRWDEMAEHDVVLTTYGTMLRDIEKLHAQQFDYAILDEAQAIKNANSQSAKACRLLRAHHRLALTGTPIENHIGELWSLVEFLNPGMLGKFAMFAKLTNGSGSAEEAAHGRELLSRIIRPFILRRTKGQVLKDLPEKTEQTIYCDLSKAEREKYNELRDFYRAMINDKIEDIGLERSKIHVLEALLRLRQASCHLGLIDEKKKAETSAKLETLLEQLDELVQEGHKALVFSQFTQLLGIVKEHLDKRHIRYEYLDGQTRDRQQRVERFQTDASCPLFLVSLKAGGRGLNLTAADYVFILDPWWNPAVEAQAIDRAHRMGQTQPVFAYRLIARDTVEEKIVELQRSKRELADSIISADSSVLKNLSAEDLRLLLS